MTDKYIDVYFITKKNCSKCLKAKPIVEQLEQHPNIKVTEVSGESLSREYIIKNNLTYVPALMVFVDGEQKGIISKGFTERGIKRQISALTKVNFA